MMLVQYGSYVYYNLGFVRGEIDALTTRAVGEWKIVGNDGCVSEV